MSGRQRLDKPPPCSLFVLTPIEPLGQARDAGVHLTARCAWGRRGGMKSIRQCKASIRLDLETLIWMRGASAGPADREVDGKGDEQSI